MDALQERKQQWKQRQDEYFVHISTTGAGNASLQEELEDEFINLLLEEYAPEAIEQQQRYNQTASHV